MTEKEYFRKTYPDACYGDKPLSPCWDYFQDGVEFGERQSEEKITKAKGIIRELLSSCFGYNSKTVNYEVKTKAEQLLKELENE